MQMPAVQEVRGTEQPVAATRLVPVGQPLQWMMCHRDHELRVDASNDLERRDHLALTDEQ